MALVGCLAQVCRRQSMLEDRLDRVDVRCVVEHWIADAQHLSCPVAQPLVGVVRRFGDQLIGVPGPQTLQRVQGGRAHRPVPALTADLSEHGDALATTELAQQLRHARIRPPLGERLAGQVCRPRIAVLCQELQCVEIAGLRAGHVESAECAPLRPADEPSQVVRERW